MAMVLKPAFRADQVGSLLRPQYLIAARQQWAAGALEGEALKKVEDRAIREIVALQESIGLRSITDGEYRRQSYIVDFFFKALGKENVSFNPGLFFHRNDRGDKLPAERMVVHARARWSGPIFAEDFSFVRSITSFTPKVTVPSPVIVHFLGGDDAIIHDAYATLDEFWADMVEVYRREFAALLDAGCSYLQIDETSLVKFGDPEVRSILEARGHDWRALAESYVEVLNAILATVPTGMRAAIHVCRGNRLGSWQADTGYHFMADYLFRKLKADLYLLEFDSARAGSLDALGLMQEGKSVVLGLVTTKSPALESAQLLQERVREASQYIPLEQLALSPQCGFSGDVRNRAMTLEQQMEKLRLVVETSRSIWGDAS